MKLQALNEVVNTLNYNGIKDVWLPTTQDEMDEFYTDLETVCKTTYQLKPISGEPVNYEPRIHVIRGNAYKVDYFRTGNVNVFFYIKQSEQ